MEQDSLKSTYTLADGNRIPCVGFGTWQTPDGDVAYKSVLAALRNGYRHIDTATAYGNEESVGKAINECTEAYKAQVIAERALDTAIQNNPFISGASSKALTCSLSPNGIYRYGLLNLPAKGGSRP